MHFLVHVILPSSCTEPVSESEVERAVERALLPFFNDGTKQEGWYDWYELGGRFAGAVVPQQPLRAPESSGWLAKFKRPKPPEHTAYGREVLAAWTADNAPFVVVTPDGVAHGAEDWTKEPFDVWDGQFRALLGAYSEHLVVGVDCHA